MGRTGLSLRRLAADPPTPPLCDAVAAPIEPDLRAIDDRTATYILAVREGFERLNDAARQMAALLILEASGSGPMQDHPVRALARRNLDEAREKVGQARPTARAEHHHRHLVQAVLALGSLFAGSDDRTMRSGVDIGRPLRTLKRAVDHLGWASRALPGFEVVALGQGCGCCASARRSGDAQE